MGLEGSKDEIEHQLPVSPRSLLHLLRLLKLSVVSHWFDDAGSIIQLPRLELSLPSLLDLVPEQISTEKTL